MNWIDVAQKNLNRVECLQQIDSDRCFSEKFEFCQIIVFRKIYHLADL